MSAPETKTADRISQTEEKHLKTLLDEVIERTEQQRGAINMTPEGIDFGNFEGVWRWANMVFRSKMVPKGFDTPESICIAALKGRSVGLRDPFEALWSMAVINGRPTIWGDLPLAICRQHKDWMEGGFEEYFEVGGKRVDRDPDPNELKDMKTAAVCETLRRGAKMAKVIRFSMAHAQAAGLLGKNGSLYVTYGQRMLRFRARGYCLRDNFGDALKGFGIAEIEDAEQTQAPRQEPSSPPVGRTSLRTPKTEPVTAGAATNGHEKPSEESPPEDPPGSDEHSSGQAFPDEVPPEGELTPAKADEIEIRNALDQANGDQDELRKVWETVTALGPRYGRLWESAMRGLVTQAGYKPVEVGKPRVAPGTKKQRDESWEK